MKQFKNVLAVVLMLVLCISTLTPAFAADVEKAGMAPSPNDFKLIELAEDASASVQWDAVAEYVVSALLKRTEKISLSDFKIPNTGANVSALSNIVYATPKMLRYCNGFNYSYNKTYLTYLTPKYDYTAEEFEVMRREADEGLEEIIGDLRNADIPDLYKVVLVHDRIAASTSYDYANYLDMIDGKIDDLDIASYSAYGVLGKKVAVCQGYAYAVNWCLDELGIPSYEVDSDILNHAWNKVILDGKTYFLDATHDDPVWDISGKVLHKYCLVTAETYSDGHNGTADFPMDEAIYDNYEDAFWKDVNSQVQLYDNELYYINVSSKNLEKIDADGNIATVTSLGSSSYIRFSKLLKSGNKLIYNIETKVYSYDLLTGKTELIYTLDTNQYSGYRIYGLSGKGCSLVLEISKSATFTRDTKNNAITTGNHDYTSEVTQATCTTDGYTTYTCSYCNDTYTADKVSATGHKEYLATPALESSCVKEGKTAEIRCEKCHTLISASVTIPKKQHTVVTISGTPASCTTAGLTDGKKCSVCDTVLESQTIIPKGEHKYQVTTKEPTCEQAGYSTAVCSVCGDIQTKVLDAYNHKNAYGTKGLAATCTEDGFTPGVYCPDCKQYISGHEIEKAKGHKEQTVLAVEPTCKAEGHTQGVICSVCKIALVPYETISKKEHTPVAISAVKPTCVREGKTEGVKCSVCGDILVPQETVVKLPHVDVDGDGHCDECGTRINNNPSENCSCNCHKSGFKGFIYKIQLVFWKLFKTNKTCKCGVNHY